MSNKEEKEEEIIDTNISYEIKKKYRDEEIEEENKVLEQYIRIFIFVAIIIFLMFITMREAVTFSRDVDNISINWKTLTLNLPDYGYNLYQRD